MRQRSERIFRPSYQQRPRGGPVSEKGTRVGGEYFMGSPAGLDYAQGRFAVDPRGGRVLHQCGVGVEQ